MAQNSSDGGLIWFRKWNNSRSDAFITADQEKSALMPARIMLTCLSVLLFAFFISFVAIRCGCVSKIKQKFKTRTTRCHEKGKSSLSIIHESNDVRLNNVDSKSNASFPEKVSEKVQNTVYHYIYENLPIAKNLQIPICKSNSNGRTFKRATQTRSSLMYPTNIFATPWSRKCIIKPQGGVWETPDSDVKVIFQPDSFKKNLENIEIHGSTFGDITDIRHKFNIEENFHIIAPVAEFTLNISEKLSKYAVVEIPHSMTTDLDEIRVQWFPSMKTSYGTIQLKDIPLRCKNKEDEDDMMYEVTNDKIRVFTRHFSGFVCTVCGKKRDILICATVFGSYRFIKNSEWNVNVRAYLSDQNVRIKEFQREMSENEYRRNMKQLDQKSLPIKGKLSSDTQLSLTFEFLDEGDHNAWQHVTKPKAKDKVLHPITQVISVGDIYRCCPLAGVNKMPMDWCLKNMGSGQPDNTFRFFLEIKASTLKDEVDSEEINMLFDLDRTEKGEKLLMHETLDSTDPVEKITRCLASELTKSQCIDLCREMGSTTLEINSCNKSYHDVPKEFCYQLLHGCLFKRVKSDQLFERIQTALPKIGEEIILRKIEEDLRRIQYSAVQEEIENPAHPLIQAVQVSEQEQVPNEETGTFEYEETSVKLYMRNAVHV